MNSRGKGFNIPGIHLGSLLVISTLSFFCAFLPIFSHPLLPGEMDYSVNAVVHHHSLREQIELHVHDIGEEETDKVAEDYEHVSLRPLNATDVSSYTVRVNVWTAGDQLEVVTRHYASCPTVAQVQLIWRSHALGPLPDWLSESKRNPKVKIEEHASNSLNERYRILIEPPTAGILNVGTDSLRPCAALDATFWEHWVPHPDRIVGFEPRGYRVRKSGSWKISDNLENSYSMIDARYFFAHVDYIRSYWKGMPEQIRDYVEGEENCDDLAMSLWMIAVSSSPPMLADGWASDSAVLRLQRQDWTGKSSEKLNNCLTDFAKILELQYLPSAPIYAVDPDESSRLFERGVQPKDRKPQMFPRSAHQLQVEDKIRSWKQEGTTASSIQMEVASYMEPLMEKAMKKGVLAGHAEMPAE